MRSFKVNIIITAIASLTAMSCTDLDEGLKSDLDAKTAEAIIKKNADVDALVEAVYQDLNNTFPAYGNVFHLQEVAADEAIVPSRPSGWDDDGLWRTIYTHTWTPDHPSFKTVFNLLNKGVFDATNVLNFNPSPAAAAEARFLRAYFMYSCADLFGKVPVRDPGGNLLTLPAVYQNADAIDFVISEIEAVMADLPDTGPAYKATKNAARALLARVYLNRGMYTNRSNPSFDAKDMDKVITYADQITGKSLDFYWNNFGPNNGEISTELIFSIQGIGGVRGNGLENTFYAALPSELELPLGGGWNGWATTQAFYESFTDGDIRKSYDHPLTKPTHGYNVGFLEGQQHDKNNNPIPGVILTKEITTLQGETNYAGVRVLKYVPDFANPGASDNDWSVVRYADVLLMKAEALFRKGNTDEALTIVNDLRANRSRSAGSLPPLTAPLTLDNILAERGRELYWEGIRRTDLIRFGKFLDARLLKPKSDPKYLVYPIPRESALANSNLGQNPDY